MRAADVIRYSHSRFPVRTTIVRRDMCSNGTHEKKAEKKGKEKRIRRKRNVASPARYTDRFQMRRKMKDRKQGAKELLTNGHPR